jgi:adenine-specific DNA-methyltransferase
MGSIEETIPVKIPMADGLKSNAIFFKLGFLDKTEVAFGRNLKELIPLLWMKANAIGECPNMEFDTTPDMIILPENKMAILVEEDAYPKFKDAVSNGDIETVFIITDSEDGYREMTSRLNVKQTYQLYRDYLDNFTINK